MTDHARKAVFYAQDEARKLSDTFVSTEHFLLGMTRLRDCSAIQTLEELGVSSTVIRAELKRFRKRINGRVPEYLRLTPAAKRVIDFAYGQARAMNQVKVGTEHLLLGLLLEDDSLAARVLTELGVSFERTREVVQNLPESRAELRRPRFSLTRAVFDVFKGSQKVRAKPANSEAAEEEPEPPWNRLTKRGRRAIFFAEEEAARLGDCAVSTEHLLLGLMRDEHSIAVRVLDRMGVSCEKLRVELEQQAQYEEGRQSRDLPFTQRAKRTVSFAYDEARQMQVNFIGTEHLLLGIIRGSEGLAGRVLNRSGVYLERARKVVESLNVGNP